jgi:predicted nucleotidyltransferase
LVVILSGVGIKLAYLLKNNNLEQLLLIHKIKITILISESISTIMEVVEKQDIIQKLSNSKEQLFSKYGIKELAIFGSVSRGDNTASSDLDILVEFNRKIGIEFIDLADELEGLLKMKVDLVSKNGIKKKYFQFIEKDLEYV